ncbi:MAG TPA: deoxyribodipyrimidine photolyase [Bacteroidetes bacterium]|jgi:deoxyribodipyrimidine photo-lyase|nr:deoxyribodipyrimidine photolyase [Bacteroidota bacterium]
MNLAIHWFKRDLRLADNAALYYALKSGIPVQPIFIFDTEILNKLEDKSDARVTFIHQELSRLKQELQALGSDLLVYYGNPVELWPSILEELQPSAVYTNRDYEPYAKKRDTEVSTILLKHPISFNTYKDHVLFEMDEVLKDDDTPYVVFTPYSRKWKATLTPYQLKPYPTEKYFNSFNHRAPTPLITLEEMGFKKSKIAFPPKTTTLSVIKNYEANRDFPAIAGTSRLSLHLRFGTVSIRDKAAKGKKTSEKWLNELIWRDFYVHILHHFPHTVEGSFKPQYDQIHWSTNEEHFKAWCEGMTGYGLVDAGMRELNATGFMHNRVRMVVASFLTKHLLLNWRWGEAYFAQKLLDFDLASNNGGWQWAAGSGVDAAPYFRIFNPYTQIERFDSKHEYIKKWIPEWGTNAYPKEIVDHKTARELCLATYKSGLAPK